MTRGTKVLAGLLLVATILVLVILIVSVFPETGQLDVLSGVTAVIGFFVALGALLIAAAEYYRKKDIDEKESRPYVVASLEPKETSQNIFNLKIENTGKTLAKNVSVQISPDYQAFEGVKRMNELGILKNMGIITPGNKRLFFFGNYMSPDGERSIKKEFAITVRYTDVAGNNKYKETYINNPTDYEGMVQSSQKGLEDIHKEIKELVKSHKDEVSVCKRLESTITEKGIKIRNLHIAAQSGEDLFRLVINTYLNNSKDEFWLNPFVYDYKLLIKQCRDILLEQSVVDSRTGEIVSELNHLLEKDWQWQKEEVNAHFIRLCDIASHETHKVSSEVDSANT